MIFLWQKILGQLRGEKNLRKPIVVKTLKCPPVIDCYSLCFIFNFRRSEHRFSTPLNVLFGHISSVMLLRIATKITASQFISQKKH